MPNSNASRCIVDRIDQLVVDARELKQGRRSNAFDILCKLQELEAIAGLHFQDMTVVESKFKKVAQILKSSSSPYSSISSGNGRNASPLNPLTKQPSPRQSLHINQLVLALCTSGFTGTSMAWQALGGICTTCFESPFENTLWRNRSLPAMPWTRQVAANWITATLMEQFDPLVSHCTAAPIPNCCQTIDIPCASSSPLCVEEVSHIHLVHLEHLQTYHATKFRQHRVRLPFSTLVRLRKEHYKADLKCNSPLEMFHPERSEYSIALQHIQSAGGERLNSPSSQYILTRQFEDENSYCIVACAITKDERYPNQHGLTREWVCWTVIKRNQDNTATIIQMAVATGLQDVSTGRFVPYDNVDQMIHGSCDALFEKLTVRLVQQTTRAFRQDAQQTLTKLSGLQSQYAMNQEISIVGKDCYNHNKRSRTNIASSEKRIRRDDVFRAIYLLSQRFSEEFEAKRIAAVVDYLTRHPMDATAFVALSGSPRVQRAWLQSKFQVLRPININ
ncbi:hypothetical protein LEN26_006370 [Aphanomyces euteiches]|nr:hypothetical protein LEN26_006370 [Aphanomyces euteiches]